MDDPDTIVSAVQAEFKANSDIVNSARICLGLGLGFEDFNISMAYSAFLTGIGRQGYGELVAGHFALGLGEPQDLERAEIWYQWTADSIAEGADAIAGLESEDRAALLAYLADSIGGGGDLTRIALSNQQTGPRKREDSGLRSEADLARDFFALEKYRIVKMMPALQTLVGMTRDDLNDACSDANQGGTLGAFGAGELDTAFVRLCRAAAYVEEKTAAMADYDQILADAGDPNALAALRHHRVLGH